MGLSLSDRVRALPPGERRRFVDEYAGTPEQATALRFSWPFWGRPEQQAPIGDWSTWLVLAGRGWGKTRTGAELVRSWAEDDPHARIALVGRTAADVRDVLVEGESGLMSCCPPWFLPVYTPSKRRVTFPNGAQAFCYSADEPAMLRGPQHTHAWADELAAWWDDDAWDQLQFGLRLGSHPRVVVTTTPRPRVLLKRIMALGSTVVTRGSTHDNLHNLAPTFRDAILSRYEGTALGRQEIYAEVLDETPGALWRRAQIEALRVDAVPDLVRVVVAVDPSVTSNDDSAETGIVAVGLGVNGHCYVLADASVRDTPSAWARRAIETARQFGADRVVYEANQGGELVANVLTNVDKNAPLRAVHASRGKRARAEPIAALYEQGRFHHVGCFPRLEDQLCEWAPGDDSPDRLDALVWAGTELTQHSVAVVAAAGPATGSRWSA